MKAVEGAGLLECGGEGVVRFASGVVVFHPSSPLSIFFLSFWRCPFSRGLLWLLADDGGGDEDVGVVSTEIFLGGAD